MTEKLYLDNDNVIELLGVKNNVTGAFFTAGATVTAKLLDQAGSVIVAETPLAFVVGSDGDFRATWDESDLPSASVTPGTYLLVYDAEEGGLELHIEVHVPVVVRRS